MPGGRAWLALAPALALASGCAERASLSGPPRGVYAVDDFGARHDGVTDDGPAIRAAIAAAEITGGVVQFGPGVYVFRDSLEITSSSIVLRGVGRANPREFDRGRGTVLEHRPSPAASAPTALRIGHGTERIVASGIEDLTLRGSTGHTGHLLWMEGVERCHLARVDLFHNAADGPGRAALLVSSRHAGAPTTGCWFDAVHVFCPRNEGGEGYGIVLACDGPTYTTDLSFVHLKVSNAAPPGRSLWIRRAAEGGVNANHRFVNCRFDGQAGDTGLLVDAPRCGFVNCTVDNPRGTDDLVVFTERARDCHWLGRVDGRIVSPLAGHAAAPRILH